MLLLVRFLPKTGYYLLCSVVWIIDFVRRKIKRSCMTRITRIEVDEMRDNIASRGERKEGIRKN
jgi:hypothetical protein